MYLINQYGDKVQLPNNTLPKSMTNWLYADAQLIPEDLELEKCWVAQVNRYSFDDKTYNFKGEEVYDHEPTQEELIWLMGKYDSLRFSYVSVLEAWRLKDEDD